MNWWRQIFSKILRLFGRRPAQLGAGEEALLGMEESAEDLPLDLQEIVRRFAGQKGVVPDTVARALRDYRHLQEVMMGPGATVDAVDDVTLIAEAHQLLRAILLRAPEVKTLLEIASKRDDDRAGRSSAGDAALVLRDQGRVLHNLASAALQWASSRSKEDRKALEECAERLVV